MNDSTSSTSSSSSSLSSTQTQSQSASSSKNWYTKLVLCGSKRPLLMISIWTLIYYVTSAVSSIWNKWLVDSSHAGVAPTTLTLLHLAIGLASDSTIRHYTEDNLKSNVLANDHKRTSWDILVAFLPISIFVTLTKLTTYWSYQYVSIALAHTAKASEPIFNVIVAAVVFGEFHSRQVYLSLLPISIGIFLASVSDFSYNHTGFFIAVLSALAKVLQNIYTKRLMETGKFTFWEVHLYCGAASLIVLSPVLFLQQFTFETNPFAHLPLFALLFDSILQWTSSVSSYIVLSLVSHLTATVINVMKRFLMIVSGDLFDGNGLAPLNVVGVCLAMIGILLYNIVKDGDFTFATTTTSGSGGGGVGLVQELPPWIALSKVFIDPIFSFFAVTLIRPITFFCSACSLILPIEIQRSLSSIVGYISMLVSVASRKLYGDIFSTDSTSSFSSSSNSELSFETTENSNSTLTSSTSHQRRQQVVISVTSSLEN
jgi:solute carrier family 35, member E1